MGVQLNTILRCWVVRPYFYLGGTYLNKNYDGVKTVIMDDEQMSCFYSSPTDNSFTDCIRNQYLVLQNSEEQAVGTYHWDGESFTEVPYRVFQSTQFNEIKPKNKDPYQIAYMDSIVRNQITFATGPAGSGKSLLAFAYAFQELEKGNLGKIIVFTNPFVSQGAVKLGFLPGTKTEKLLETSIGSILISKLGERKFTEYLIEKEKIVLMPMGDCRGYEVPEDSFVYFTEAQNTDIGLMKLFLQRTNDNCKIIVEGDVEAQVDAEQFSGKQNGLRRAIDVFAGESYAGHVRLVNNYRGRIARKAEEMTP